MFNLKKKKHFITFKEKSSGEEFNLRPSRAANGKCRILSKDKMRYFSCSVLNNSLIYNSLSFYAKNERCGLFCAAGDYPECNS